MCVCIYIYIYIYIYRFELLLFEMFVIHMHVMKEIVNIECDLLNDQHDGIHQLYLS